MLDETNHVPVEAVTPANDGQPVLKALKDLLADDAKARAIGKAGQHLATEVLHPDNVDRQAISSPLQIIPTYERYLIDGRGHLNVPPFMKALQRIESQIYDLDEPLSASHYLVDSTLMTPELNHR